MKDCNKFELFISMELDNELNNEEKELLKNHLKKCSSCQKKKEEFQKLKIAMNSNIKFSKPVSKEKKYSFKRFVIPAIAALLLIISGAIFSIYYNFNKNNTTYLNNTIDYPLSSFIEDEENSKYEYSVPMSSYIMYSYNE
ncbi:MAG TPA: zf-HC2 domain-containing protein [Spirochaetota bacterium]|nr:zf-HC2 domain-containing protein [Spirochaetota bacterium]HOL57847.1 zf-HC2 domain-containing protein [Spirochaetota bacterium]